jgi:hypothetical protein
MDRSTKLFDDPIEFYFNDSFPFSVADKDTLTNAFVLIQHEAVTTKGEKSL